MDFFASKRDLGTLSFHKNGIFIPWHRAEELPLSLRHSSALYRKSILDKIGVFDELFFAYYEDVDLSWRANTFGYKNVFCPTARCRHICGASTGAVRYNPFKSIQSGRNSILPGSYTHLRDELLAEAKEARNAQFRMRSLEDYDRLKQVAEEMCIRDRPPSAWSTARPPPCA